MLRRPSSLPPVMSAARSPTIATTSTPVDDLGKGPLDHVFLDVPAPIELCTPDNLEKVNPTRMSEDFDCHGAQLARRDIEIKPVIPQAEEHRLHSLVLRKSKQPVRAVVLAEYSGGLFEAVATQSELLVEGDLDRWADELPEVGIIDADEPHFGDDMGIGHRDSRKGIHQCPVQVEQHGSRSHRSRGWSEP